jgi:hypothetical protein
MDTRLGVDILSNSGRTRLHIDIMSKLKTPIGLVHETAREAGLHHYVIKSAICPRGRLVSIPQWWTKRAESDLVLAIYEGHNPNWNPIPSREGGVEDLEFQPESAGGSPPAQYSIVGHNSLPLWHSNRLCQRSMACASLQSLAD